MNKDITGLSFDGLVQYHDELLTTIMGFVEGTIKLQSCELAGVVDMIDKITEILFPDLAENHETVL